MAQEDDVLNQNFNANAGGSNNSLANKKKKLATTLFTKLNSDDVIENAMADTITAAMWDQNDSVLTGSNETYTSSAQINASGLYYTEIFRTDPATDTTAEPQFAFAYGHADGSGSAPLSQYATEGMTPTKAVYGQYANLCLAKDQDTFKLSDDTAVTASIFVNVNRSRYKERVDPGQWDITLSGSLGGIFTLTDDSIKTSATLGDMGAVYNVVSGSAGDTETTIDTNSATAGVTTHTKPYGLFYPDLGVIMLDPAQISMSADSNNYCWCNDSSTYDIYADGVSKNPFLTGSLTTAFTDSTFAFEGRSAESVYSTHYFIRLKNSSYNFSNNPSFTTGTNGEFAHTTMFKDPKVYVTTVGMYNDRNELLAIAKLSKPLLKSFTREALIRVKLEY